MATLPPQQPTQHKEITNRSVLTRILSGGLAGMFAKTLTAPLERIKMLSQTGETSSKSSFKTNPSIIQIYRTVLKTEGVSGLFAGNGANLVRIFPAKGVVFTANDVYKDQLMQLSANPMFGGDGVRGGKASPGVSFMAGGMSGMTASAVTYPLDLIRGRIGGKSVAADGKKKYSGIMNVIKITISEEGFFALYRGLTPTLLGAVPYEGIKFGTVGFLETMFPLPPPLSSSSVSSGEDSYLNNNVLRKVTFGALGGVSAGVLTYPNDTIRRLLQLQGTHSKNSPNAEVYTSYRDCMVKTYRKGGIRRFYAGLSVNLIRMAPNTAIQFGTYEVLKDFFG